MLVRPHHFVYKRFESEKRRRHGKNGPWSFIPSIDWRKQNALEKDFMLSRGLFLRNPLLA